MAMYRQRVHERRVHELSVENQDLVKDVDRLEDALELHKRLKHKDETSVKGVIRKEVGGSIWQHGGEGKLHTYKSNKDLDNEPSHKVEKHRVAKKKHNQGPDLNIDLEPKVGKVTSRGKNSINGGSSIGAKGRNLRPSSATLVKDKDNLSRKKKGSVLLNAGATYAKNEINQDLDNEQIIMKQTFLLADDDEISLDCFSKQQTLLGETVTLQASSIDKNGAKIKAYSGSRTAGKSYRNVESESKTENRIEVLNKMINKLRDSWQLDETCHRTRTYSKPWDPLVVEWLQSLNLKQIDKYIDIFTKNEIDVESLKLLNETQLRNMGITAIGSLTKLLHGIDQVKSGTYKFGLKQDSAIDNYANENSPEFRVKRKMSPNKEVSSHISKDGSLLPSKSMLTTKSGRNTFNPKDFLQDLESSESDCEEILVTKSASKSKMDRNSVSPARRLSNNSKSGVKVDGRTVLIKAKEGVAASSSASGNRNALLKAGKVNTGRNVDKRPGTAPTTRRGIISQRTPGKPQKKGSPVKSAPGLKDTESEYGDLEDLISIRTVVQDVSADDTTEDFTALVEDQNLEAEETRADSAVGSGRMTVVIPQHEGQQTTDSDLDEDDQLKGIEHEIRSLADDIARPGAMDRIVKLQDKLREIQEQILMKKRQNQEQEPEVQEIESPKETVEESPYIPQLDITGKSLYHMEAAVNTQDDRQEKQIELLAHEKESAKDSKPEPRIPFNTNTLFNTKAAPVSAGKLGPVSPIAPSKPGPANRNMSKGELLKEVRKQKDQHRKQIRHLESELSRLKHKDPLRSCEVAENEVHYTEQDLIGEGAFSQVYHGLYQGSEVALKRLKIPLTAQDKNYFMAEVNLLKDLRHPRVVLLMGVCTTSKLPLMVLEFMANGSLYSFLHNTNNDSFDHAAYYQIARDTALGMNYLHLHKPTVLHLDLKSMNVLLSLQLRAKIADFGFSKLRHDADMKAKEKKSQPGSRAGTGQHVKGTPAWLAPEMLDFKQVTTKADVFSFGVILWEMLTRRHPYQGCSVFQIIERVRTNKRPEIPSDCPSQLATLISKCWDKNTAKRPQFKDILLTLEELHLPSEWKQLFTAAGIPNTTLNDINATRTLISLVNDTLEKVERPSDVPVLDLYDSDDCDKKHRHSFSDSSYSDDDQDYYQGNQPENKNDEEPAINTLDEQMAFYDKLASALQGMDEETLSENTSNLRTDTHRIEPKVDETSGQTMNDEKFVSQLTDKLNKHIKTTELPNFAKSFSGRKSSLDDNSTPLSSRKSVPCDKTTMNGNEKSARKSDPFNKSYTNGDEHSKPVENIPKSARKSVPFFKSLDENDITEGPAICISSRDQFTDNKSVLTREDSVKSPESWTEELSMYKALPQPSRNKTTAYYKNKHDKESNALPSVKKQPKSSSLLSENALPKSQEKSLPPPPPPIPPPSLSLYNKEKKHSVSSLKKGPQNSNVKNSDHLLKNRDSFLPTSKLDGKVRRDSSQNVQELQFNKMKGASSSEIQYGKSGTNEREPTINNGKSNALRSTKPATSADTKNDANIVDLRASQLIAKRKQLKPSLSTDPPIINKPRSDSQPKLASMADIRASQLVERRGKLRSTDAPHPRQLVDLSQVKQSQLCDLAMILKKAVDERRMVIGENNTLDSVGTTSWDLTDD